MREYRGNVGAGVNVEPSATISPYHRPTLAADKGAKSEYMYSTTNMVRFGIFISTSVPQGDDTDTYVRLQDQIIRSQSALSPGFELPWPRTLVRSKDSAILVPGASLDGGECNWPLRLGTRNTMPFYDSFNSLVMFLVSEDSGYTGQCVYSFISRWGYTRLNFGGPIIIQIIYLIIDSNDICIVVLSSRPASPPILYASLNVFARRLCCILEWTIVLLSLLSP